MLSILLIESFLYNRGMHVEIKSYDYLPDEAKQIRTTVFVDEQGFRDEFDESDEHSIHILLFVDNKAVGVARIIYSDKHQMHSIGRIAILKEFRGQHLGKALVTFAEQEIIKRFGHIEIGVGAQKRVIGFYKSLNYVGDGDYYLDENYPHLWMIKNL